ncbi:uncharacterized protein [Onthophagus taurus]|uniref:uncharacterized protein n=1 Tax=Onthophagus taurus TaxID=166361 RepID=UPI0039BE79F4
MSILNVSDKVEFDNSLVRIQYHNHLPYSSNSFNNSDEIRIAIQQQDVYTLPSQSFIYVQGKLLKDDGTVDKDSKLSVNPIAHMFSEVRFECGGNVIDRVRNPGIASTLKNLCSLTRSEYYHASNAGFEYPNVKVNENTGHFDFCVPLKYFLGFAEDYNKILINLRQELVLVRSNSDKNVIESLLPNVIITINKIVWKVPHVSVADVERLKLLEYIEQGIELDMGFRSFDLHEYPSLPKSRQHTWTIKTSTQLEKPRYFILGFQINRKDNPLRSASQFDHCNLTDMKVFLNSEKYPYEALNLNFKTGQIAVLYEMYCNFAKTYYDRELAEPMFNRDTFLAHTPIIVVDCSRQNDILNVGTVDIRIEFETSEEIPNATSLYCLILHDRVFKYVPLTGMINQI